MFIFIISNVNIVNHGFIFSYDLNHRFFNCIRFYRSFKQVNPGLEQARSFDLDHSQLIYVLLFGLKSHSFFTGFQIVLM